MKTILSCSSRWLRLRQVAWACWAALALGCGTTPASNPNLDGKKPPVTMSAQLIFVQAAVDVAALDVWVDGEPRLGALAPRQGSMFLTLPAGSHKLDLRRTAAPASDAPLWSGSIYLQDGQRVLACALGRAADSATAASPTRLTVIAEKLGDAGPGQQPLRLLHAAPALASLDLIDSDLGGKTLVQGTSFARFSGYVDVASTPTKPRPSLRLGLRQSSEAFDLAYLLSTVEQLASLQGHPQTAIVLGETNPLAGETASLGALLLDEQTGALRELSLEPNALGPKATLYMLNASPDAGAVDVYSKINGARLVGALDYRQATPLLALIPTHYPIEVRQASLPTVLLRTNLRLLPNQHWAVYLGGRQQGDTPSLRLVALPRTPMADGATLRRGVHAIADAKPDSRITLTTAAGPSFVDPVPFAAASPYRSGPLTAEPLRLGLGGSKQGWEVDLPQLVVDAAAGQVLALYVTGTLGDPRAPLSTLAVLESSATSSQAALVIALRTTLLPSP